MFTQKQLDRINELAKKKKTVGLSEEELKEQTILREEYLKDFRSRLKQQLDNIEIVDADDPRLKNNKPVS